MVRDIVATDNAPAAIGPYSQAVLSHGLLFLSGQIPLDPHTQQLVIGDVQAQARRVFENLAAVCVAAGGTLDNVVKLTIYLTDMAQFAAINEVMREFFHAPFPARAVVGVAALPRDAMIEADAIVSV